MRKYSIGAFLLDSNDPSKVIGRLRKLVVAPNESEREGYVPNVVYSYGALLHNGVLIIPYAVADHATSFVTVQLDEVLAGMEADYPPTAATLQSHENQRHALDNMPLRIPRLLWT